MAFVSWYFVLVKSSEVTPIEIFLFNPTLNIWESRLLILHFDIVYWNLIQEEERRLRAALVVQAAARRWLVARQSSPVWSQVVTSQTRILSEDRVRQVHTQLYPVISFTLGQGGWIISMFVVPWDLWDDHRADKVWNTLPNWSNLGSSMPMFLGWICVDKRRTHNFSLNNYIIRSVG